MVLWRAESKASPWDSYKALHSYGLMWQLSAVGGWVLGLAIGKHLFIYLFSRCKSNPCPTPCLLSCRSVCLFIMLLLCLYIDHRFLPPALTVWGLLLVELSPN
jgi:hypothetical protein